VAVSLHQLLKTMTEMGGTDLHVTTNSAPQVRIDVSSDRYNVRVTVEDSGLGIPDEAREQLFRPFFTTKTHGTGLGLASSRAVAESHEGSLDVENVAGGGTRFCLRLPASAKAEEADA